MGRIISPPWTVRFSQQNTSWNLARPAAYKRTAHDIDDRLKPTTNSSKMQQSVNSEEGETYTPVHRLNVAIA